MLANAPKQQACSEYRSFPLQVRAEEPVRRDPADAQVGNTLQSHPALAAVHSLAALSSKPLMAQSPPIQRAVTMPALTSACTEITSAPSSSVNLQAAKTQSYQGRKPSHGKETPAVVDVSPLISSAGSAEAALQSLAKEKQSINAQNAQLWRLVEKQRAMILTLNKDLVKALKDRDKYRKKLKDHLAQAPALYGNAQESADPADLRQRSQSPASTEPTEELPSPGSTTSIQEIIAKGIRNPVAAFPAHDVASTVRAPKDTPQLCEKPAPTRSLHSPKSDHNFSHPKGSLFRSFSDNHPIPTASPNDFANPSEPTPPTRKGPPTPLLLSPILRSNATLQRKLSEPFAKGSSNHQLHGSVDPHVFERGRQKTRAVDDRMREMLAMREEQERSRSTKDKKVKKASSIPPPFSLDGDSADKADLPLVFANDNGLPASPRNPSFGSLQSPTSHTAQQLEPVLQSQTATQRNIVTLPPKSPGLPLSPRPADRPVNAPTPRMPRQQVSSPSLPHGRVAVPPSPRAPRQSIPLPPLTPLAAASPHLARVGHWPQQPSSPTLYGDRLVDSAQPGAPIERELSLSIAASGMDQYVQDILSGQLAGARMPARALPFIEVKVSSSRMRPSRNSFVPSRVAEEDAVFTLAICNKVTSRRLWRLEKTFNALTRFDLQSRRLSGVSRRMPDRSLFTGHAPAKVDARRVALDDYFGSLLENSMHERAAEIVCDFLSSDVVEEDPSEGKSSPISSVTQDSTRRGRASKEGYLTKKGKNFGGWKARYFVLEGTEFRYFESPTGPLLGTIKIQRAQVGRQNLQLPSHSPSRKDEDRDDQFRHSFMILEPKKRDSNVLIRHILCAESDGERDAWVKALMQNVEEPIEVAMPGGRTTPPNVLRKGLDANKKVLGNKRSQNLDASKVRGVSYSQTIAGQAPVFTDQPLKRDAPASPQKPALNSKTSHPTISAPTKGGFIADAEAWGNLSAPTRQSRELKKRSMFGLRARSPSSQDDGHAPSLDSSERGRAVFGVPLAEAVEYSTPRGLEILLPSVVYRSLEHLRYWRADEEKGLFRLPGSNNVIQKLRDRFNNEGDVDLLESVRSTNARPGTPPEPDVHAVASLLKSYLRELPAPILTRDLHLDFLKVLGM